jgi:hypothetical protein
VIRAGGVHNLSSVARADSKRSASRSRSMLRNSHGGWWLQASRACMRFGGAGGWSGDTPRGHRAFVLCLGFASPPPKGDAKHKAALDWYAK